MKQFLFVICFFVCTGLSLAQAPQTINYQGVARNSSGIPYSGQQVSIRISVRTETPTGTVAYSETRTVATNSFGLFSLQIGSPGASNVTGSFEEINWANTTQFLQTEISVNNQPFLDLGTTQMAAVPYAISSKQSRQLQLPFDTAFNSHSASAFKVSNTSVSANAAIEGQSTNGNAILGSSQLQSGIVGYSYAAQKGAVTGSNPALGGYGVFGNTSASNTTGAGVYGNAINASGVMGETTFGNGILGIANGNSSTAIRAIASGDETYGIMVTAKNGKAISSFATGATGTAASFYQANPGGMAMEVTGNVRISGGNTNPGMGKVLTSDAIGNASWQAIPSQATPKVAFKIKDVYPGGLNNYSESNWFKVYYNTVEYDYGSSISAGGTTSHSVFTAPNTGLYHFDASVGVNKDGIFAWIDLVKINASGQHSSIKTMVYGETLMDDPANIAPRQTYSVSTDAKLTAGDRVYVRFRWINGHFSETTFTGISATSGGSVYFPTTQFSGHLVIAD